MDPELQRGFRLLDREVFPEQNRIADDGKDVHVVPTTMAVLVCLAEHAGEVLSRAFLDRRVWCHRVVTDHALTNCISELRRALGDTREKPRFIETVPKRGYRLIASVTPLDDPEPARARPSRRLLLPLASLLLVLLAAAGIWRSLGGAPETAATGMARKSIAVLPFDGGSGDRNRRYIADGLSQDLITALSQFENLKVINRHSAFQYRHSNQSSVDIGRALDVAYLLEGSVRRQGDRVRISATLVNAGDGSVVWSHRYDRPHEDLFALQDAIVQAVAGALEARLLSTPGAVVQSDRPPGGSIAAYAAYQRGLAYFELGTTASFRHAIEAFRHAIRLDPRYAAAHAQLARTWTRLGTTVLDDARDTARTIVKAREASATALALDPDSALAHAARAFLLHRVYMDWHGAEAEYRRALELAPYSTVAQIGLARELATLGHVTRAVTLTRKALASDPRNAESYYWLSTWLASLGRLDEAGQAARTAITLQPGSAIYHMQLAMVATLRGDAGTALAAARQEPPGHWHDYAVAFSLQIGNDRAAAGAALESLVADHADSMPYQIAGIHALREEPDAMFHWMDHAWERHDGSVESVLYDPLLLRYRDDPRFAAFCHKIGLPASTDAVAWRPSGRPRPEES